MILLLLGLEILALFDLLRIELLLLLLVVSCRSWRCPCLERQGVAEAEYPSHGLRGWASVLTTGRAASAAGRCCIRCSDE